jgi:hypothetical protein
MIKYHEQPIIHLEHYRRIQLGMYFFKWMMLSSYRSLLENLCSIQDKESLDYNLGKFIDQQYHLQQNF